MKTVWYAVALGASCLVSFNVKSHDNQSLAFQQDVKFVSSGSSDNNYLQPITFTSAGIEQFIKQQLNKPYYAKEILPNDFRHLLQLLHFGKQTASGSYAKSVFKLFNNTIKGASYVNAYAFSHMINQLPLLAQSYVKPTPLLPFNDIKTQINDILYSSFLSQFDLFKQNPDNFFSSVSDNIIDHLNKIHTAHDMVSHKDVQSAVASFLDICLNKLIWNPQEHESIWKNIKEISQTLEQLTEKGILQDTDKLDDLYWSLVHRFCFFMDIASHDLPVCFYEEIKKDLVQTPLLLVDLEEQEAAITSKGEHLMLSLLEGEAKARMKTTT